MVQHVLTQGGFPSYTAEPSSPSLGERHTQESSTSLSSSQLSHSNYFLSALNNTDPFASFGHTLSPAQIPSDSHTLPIPNPHPHTADVPFTNLLDETREVICSSDFTVVLENCLDRAVQVLFDGLEKNVFVDSAVGSGEEVRIRLAGLLPGLSRWSSLALRSVPCELVDVSFFSISHLTSISKEPFWTFVFRIYSHRGMCLVYRRLRSRSLKTLLYQRVKKCNRS
jgi:peroxin-3